MPEPRSGRPGPDPTPRKKSPAKTAAGVAVVAVIAVAAGWGLTHIGKGAQGGGPGGPGGPGGGPPGAGPGRAGGARGAPGGGGRGGGRFGGRAAITVGVAPARRGAIPIQLDALGTVTPPVTATITSRVAGELTGVYFTEGQTVRKGQKLAQIDPRPFQVALQQAEGTLARDQAALANARLDLQRYQTLLAQNSIAKQQVDTQAALVRQNEGVVKSDQAAVANARLNLGYAAITAPVSGRVGLRLVDLGNFVQAGSQGLVVITQVDPIDVVFTVPEDNVQQIVRRQRAGAALPVTVFNRGGGEALAEGRLSTLDNQIDTATGTVRAKARFANPGGMLFPNQFVNVRMLTDVLCNVVIVPTTAVRHGSQGDYVFALQPDRTVKMVMVATGPGTGETVSVTRGLTGDETVITEGGDRLRDGGQVQLPGDAPRGGSGFSGGRRGRPGGPGAQGGSGPSQGFRPGQGAGQAPGAGGPGGGGFRGRRGGAAEPGGAAAMDSDSQASQAQAIPSAQIPPGACPGSGQRNARQGRGGGPAAPAAQGGPPAEGGQERRFGPGGPGGGSRGRPGGQGPGQGRPQEQGG